MASIESDLIAQGYSTHRWSNGPGFEYPVHDHAYHKVIVVLNGSITFDLPQKGRAVAMKAGDRLELPARTAHSATVGPEGVICLEGQKPAS